MLHIFMNVLHVSCPSTHPEDFVLALRPFDFGIFGGFPIWFDCFPPYQFAWWCQNLGHWSGVMVPVSLLAFVHCQNILHSRHCHSSAFQTFTHNHTCTVMFMAVGGGLCWICLSVFLSCLWFFRSYEIWGPSVFNYFLKFQVNFILLLFDVWLTNVFVIVSLLCL